jgi:microcystin-dependent protein
MADTYTAHYNLTKPQVGGDSNTWGGLLNTNLDTLDTTIYTNLTTAKAYTDTSFPIGSIIMWNSAAQPIPSNFQLCNGTNGTPDLRDRFIVGAGSSYAAGNTGGAATVGLSIANLPSHNHGINDPGHAHAISDPGHSHGVNDPGHSHSGQVGQGSGTGYSVAQPSGLNVGGIGFAGTGIWLSASATNVGVYGAYTNISTQATGSGAAHENRPPYYALAFIQRMT